MTQLGIGVAALNHDSAFQSAYELGIKKTEYWHYALEDALTLIAAALHKLYANADRRLLAQPSASMFVSTPIATLSR